MSTKHTTRRQFLRAGCLTGAAAGVTLCGISTLAASPEPGPVELTSFHYGERALNNRVLVTYATYAGSTMEVAAAIGETLGESGSSIDVRPIQEGPDIAGYDFVIIGSAVQYGQWLPEAVEFVEANQHALRQLPVALFCVHIQNLDDDAQSRRNRLAYLDKVRSLVQPVAEGYFAGKFDRRGAARLMPELVARFMPSMDRRDWSKIRQWAVSLQTMLAQA